MAKNIVFKLQRFNNTREMKRVVPKDQLDEHLYAEGLLETDLVYFDVIEQRESTRSTLENGDLFDTMVPIIIENEIIQVKVSSQSFPAINSICRNPRQLFLAGIDDNCPEERILVLDSPEEADKTFHILMATLESWSINGCFKRLESEGKIPVQVKTGPAPLWKDGPEVYVF